MSVNITATRRRSSATTTTRSSPRRYGRANPAEQRASSSLSAKRGSPQLGSAWPSQARHANPRDKGTPARARKSPRVPDVCNVGKGRRHLQAFRGSPLTDSNRRPPPYHELLRQPLATHGNGFGLFGRI